MRWLESANRPPRWAFCAWDAQNQEFSFPRIAQIYGLPATGASGCAPGWMPCTDDRKACWHGTENRWKNAARAQYRIVRPGDQQLRWIQVWGEFEEAKRRPGGNALD